MNESSEQRKKRCPVCSKEYPVEDRYCGDDGSVLQQAIVGGKREPSADLNNREFAGKG